MLRCVNVWVEIEYQLRSFGFAPHFTSHFQPELNSFGGPLQLAKFKITVFPLQCTCLDIIMLYHV